MKEFKAMDYALEMMREFDFWVFGPRVLVGDPEVKLEPARPFVTREMALDMGNDFRSRYVTLVLHHIHSRATQL